MMQFDALDAWSKITEILQLEFEYFILSLRDVIFKFVSMINYKDFEKL